MLLTSVRADEELETATHEFLHPCVIEVFHALINEVQVHSNPASSGSCMSGMAVPKTPFAITRRPNGAIQGHTKPKCHSS